MNRSQLDIELLTLLSVQHSVFLHLGALIDGEAEEVIFSSKLSAISRKNKLAKQLK